MLCLVLLLRVGFVHPPSAGFVRRGVAPPSTMDAAGSVLLARGSRAQLARAVAGEPATSSSALRILKDASILQGAVLDHDTPYGPIWKTFQVTNVEPAKDPVAVPYPFPLAPFSSG